MHLPSCDFKTIYIWESIKFDTNIAAPFLNSQLGQTKSNASAIIILNYEESQYNEREINQHYFE